MKKQLIILTAALGVCLALCSCGGKKETEKSLPKDTNISRPANESKNNDEQETAIPSQPTEPVPEEKTQETNTAPQPENVPAPNPPQTQKSVNLSEVRTSIISSCSAADPLMLETDSLSDLYGISPSAVKQSAGFVTMSGTFPHEVIMVEAVNSDSAAQVASLLQRRLDEVKEQSKSYDAQNYALAQKCGVLKNGNYVALFLSPDCEKMEKIYTGFINR